MAFRRVVTGFNKDGKSCIKWDSAIEPKTLRPGFDNVPLWATKKLPAETATSASPSLTDWIARHIEDLPRPRRSAWLGLSSIAITWSATTCSSPWASSDAGP
jgi:hypothetical protein